MVSAHSGGFAFQGITKVQCRAETVPSAWSRTWSRIPPTNCRLNGILIPIQSCRNFVVPGKAFASDDEAPLQRVPSRITPDA